MKKKKFWSYGISFNDIVSYLGSFFRTSVLPLFIGNPLKLSVESVITFLNLPVWSYQIAIAIVMAVLELIGINRLFYFISFKTTGIFYRGGACKAYGSILYTLFYTFYTAAAVFVIKELCFESVILLATLYWMITSTIYLVSGKLNFLPNKILLRIVAYSLLNMIFIIFLIIFRILDKISTLSLIVTLILAITVCVLNILNGFKLFTRKHRNRIQSSCF